MFPHVMFFTMMTRPIVTMNEFVEINFEFTIALRHGNIGFFKNQSCWKIELFSIPSSYNSWICSFMLIGLMLKIAF